MNKDVKGVVKAVAIAEEVENTLADREHELKGVLKNIKVITVIDIVMFAVLAVTLVSRIIYG